MSIAVSIETSQDVIEDDHVFLTSCNANQRSPIMKLLEANRLLVPQNPAIWPLALNSEKPAIVSDRRDIRPAFGHPHHPLAFRVEAHRCIRDRVWSARPAKVGRDLGLHLGLGPAPHHFALEFNG